MEVNGKNCIGFGFSAKGSKSFKAFNPNTLEFLQGDFYEATEDELDKAMVLAEQAFKEYKTISGVKKAEFLEAIADEIMNLGDSLITRSSEESGLPEARIIGERARTVGQLKLFASLVKEGSWVEATIDTAQPDREPLPKPDLRKMLFPIGPVVVFSASNFPLAFSTAGGDTASALAGGNPVVVKAHPSHPGTSELVAKAIQISAKKTNMPEGVFSLLQGESFTPGQKLVLHPTTKAVGFTGSLKGGKALYDLANTRKDPIPVFAEMGSVNPVFIFPEAIKTRSQAIAQQLAGSVTLGVGQFCTKPGLVIVKESNNLDAFLNDLSAAISDIKTGVMLNQRIATTYNEGISNTLAQKGIEVVAGSNSSELAKKVQANAVVAQIKAKDFLKNPELHEEVFGPYSLVIRCTDDEEIRKVAESLEGQLTTSIVAENKELNQQNDLMLILREKTGRIIFNGMPTGVEVCNAMQHGGPSPATTDGRFTSVGTSAIKRFVRPVAFQNWPEENLPDELKSSNPLNIMRWQNNDWTRNSL